MDFDFKILVVDDNEKDRDILTKYLLLRFNRDNIFHASDGKEALEIYDKINLDLIFTDISMPNMNGMKMIEHIRIDNNDIPIVIISKFEPEIYICDNLNIECYMLKPITKLHLYNVLGSL